MQFDIPICWLTADSMRHQIAAAADNLHAFCWRDRDCVNRSLISLWTITLTFMTLWACNAINGSVSHTDGEQTHCDCSNSTRGDFYCAPVGSDNIAICINTHLTGIKALHILLQKSPLIGY